MYWVIVMGRRSFLEVIDKLLEGLDALHDEPFTIMELVSASGLRYETVKRVLEILEKLYSRGTLLRVKDKPRPLYIWIPNRSISEVLAYKFFQILLIKERLSVEDLKREYGLNEEDARKILELLIEKELARWIDEDAVGLLPLSYYLKLPEKAKIVSAKI